ncbi:sugar phosphate nucleotidyltransferase [Fusobacterium sp.]|uniref:sugar phosphate nucleotidyltransferase n=1 Tax=Fusobacterium sp. TaxID=68766 RepID=UPI0025BAC324|nr:sugar phosphate nucleotidyltransferase [Fusobacterium sp.]
MNAIIVAAGFGSRLRPLTYSTPKPLIEVFNKPIIERNIEFLLEKGIKDICVIVGYSKEKFEYLKEKYKGVRLVYNNKYAIYNNIYSLYLVREYLENTYIIEGDIYLNRNIFEKELKTSCYFSKKISKENNEWQLITEDEKVKRVEIGGKNNYIMSGISFWTKEDSLKIRRILEEYANNEEIKKSYYWDHIIKENIEEFKNIKIKQLSEEDIYEIDTLDELSELDNSYKEILNNEVKTAVILAAGKSHGFNYSNGLVKVENQILIERNIELLLKNNIDKIYIVVGYCKEQFFYLEKKYNKHIIIIENNEYRDKGSFYSLLKLKNIIKENILLLDSDILYEERALKNVLENKNENVILVSEEKGQKNETFVEELEGYLYKISKDRRELKNIDGEMLGVSKLSYFLLKYLFNLNADNSEFAYEYAISETISLFKIAIQRVDGLIWGEINNKNQLEYIEDKIYPRLLKVENEQKIEEIKYIFLEEMKEIDTNIERIEALGGMTNRNYLITTNDRKYVLRKSGEGTSEIINRSNEIENCSKVKSLDIDANLLVFNKETGVKITEYIEKAQTLNPDTIVLYLDKVAKILRKLHSANIEFNNKFDVFKEIEKYEKLSIELNGKFYEGYTDIKKKVLELKKKMEKLNIQLVSCHNDTVPENFIRSNDRVYLIDWEYSGINDPMWDLAAASIESRMKKVDEEKLLYFYFNREATKEEKLRLHINKIYQDFLWSIWTILKEAKGVSFGSYGIDRFNNAKKRLGELDLYE